MVQESLTDRSIRSIDVASPADERVAVLEERFPDVSVETTLPDRAFGEGGDLFGVAVDTLLENAASHSTDAEPLLQVTVQDSPADGHL